MDKAIIAEMLDCDDWGAMWYVILSVQLATEGSRLHTAIVHANIGKAGLHQLA